MDFANNQYRLYEEHGQYNAKYFISFYDSTGVFQKLEVSRCFYIEFRKLERKSRNLKQSDWRHNEHSELTEQTLHERAMVHPKNVDELIIDDECSELLQNAIDALPNIQQRRFLLYYEYDYNYYEIGAIENCTAQAARHSVVIAREKVKMEMEKYLCA